ncbi:hypothetical protein Tco_1411806 [Tanacetum coccineum]
MEDPRESFNKLMDTPLDLSTFVMNRLKVDTLTPELLTGPTFELMKGSCKSLITGTSNGLKIWSPTEYRVKCRLAMTNMHSMESHIGGENDNNSMDLRLTGNLHEMSTLNAESLLLRIQDIEDMLLLLVQGDLAFNVPLRMFTRSVVIQMRVEDLQSGVKSYQKKLNLTKTDTLMRIAELHKFSDGTLNDVQTALDDRLKGIQIKYLPQTIWKQSDRDKARAMIQTIDKQLKTRRIMRSLDKFVGGRPYEGDFRLLQRTI